MNYSILKFLFLCLCSSLAATSWQTDEVGAVIEMQKSKKALAIAFLKTEECPWSVKFKEELLHTPEWIETLKDHAVFLEVSSYHPEATHLRKLFQVKELPSLVLIDEEGEVIGQFSFQPGAALEFAEEILETLAAFKTVKRFIEVGNFNVGEEKLKKMYGLSCHLRSVFYAGKICEEGMKREKGHFFHLEHYKRLLYALPSQDPLVLKAKEAVLRQGDVPLPAIELTLAVIDFKKRLHFCEAHPQEPLFQYIQKYRNLAPALVAKAEELIQGGITCKG